jgi:SulP family sulfate permease
MLENSMILDSFGKHIDMILFTLLDRFLMPNKDGKYLTDFLSGLTVALALIPEAVAFALVAGVNPTVGLYAAFFM